MVGPRVTRFNLPFEATWATDVFDGFGLLDSCEPKLTSDRRRVMLIATKETRSAFHLPLRIYKTFGFHMSESLVNQI